MKNISKILIVALAAVSLTSCKDWLDINTDPVNPSSESATYQTRLPFIEFYTNSATMFANWRSNFVLGDWTRHYNGGAYWQLSYWRMNGSPSTTPYQWWFVGAGNNISYLYKKAMEAGAYEYAGAAKIIWAYGNMLMTDLYGEMPFSEACGEDATPSYDTGKEIVLGCFESLNEGIELMKKGQDPSIPSLAMGDYWCGGDAQKWIKFANLLKARWILKLSKKSAGNYLEGKYDADAILAALELAPQSIADDIYINHEDNNSTTHDNLGWNEPVDYSPLYSVCGINAGYMVTEMLYNNLTRFCGNQIEDPRADHIIPWAYCPGQPADGRLKYENSWRRSLGVDMTSGKAPNLTGGPLRASWSADKRFWINSSNPDRLADTVYVECTSSSKGYAANVDLLYRRGGAAADESKESGSFYSRVSSPSYLGTYAEACFIKAEVLFNKGDKSGAYNAYKAGVKASMDRMNVKLKEWVAEDPSLASCPSFAPMEEQEISAYVNNGLGSASDITLGKIMTQKRLAMQFSVELWNDMRRYDYNPDIFLGWAEPALHKTDAAALKAVPAGQYPRRWMQCSHEYNYNKEQLIEIGHKVPGADMKSANWGLAPDVYTIKVWWDSTEAEWPDDYRQ